MIEKTIFESSTIRKLSAAQPFIQNTLKSVASFKEGFSGDRVPIPIKATQVQSKGNLRENPLSSAQGNEAHYIGVIVTEFVHTWA